MRTAYPVIFAKIDEGYMASVPDFPIDTHGADLADAIFMARDAIGLAGLSMEDRGIPVPAPSDLENVRRSHGGIVSLVDVDFTEYRRAHDMRAIRRNVSLPSWLNSEAEKAGINVSAILQAALKRELHDAPHA
ncbi:MAG: type II toxin-antitoxin system HicB family antitoxin [Clostridiales bacterium]|jgi:predicted RNase H-like HicB family nuclease|nr:type II toxin-antitoxin system HicB family antitoxin [Clostridiales bacterium]